VVGLDGVCAGCGRGHPVLAGVVDLGPAEQAASAGAFDSIYGWLYDSSVNSRTLAPVTGRLMWGADVGRAYREMANAIACGPGEVVLDIPAGGGTTFAAGAPRLRGTLVGVDLSLGMLLRAAGRREALGLEDHVVLVRGDAVDPPLFDASADSAVCFNSLHCIPDHASVLRGIRRVLRPGGRLVGTTLCQGLSSRWDAVVRAVRLSRMFHPPTCGELARLAAAAGFRRWESERVGAMLYFRAE
jgi:SAM-dependent methyltransferase